MQSLLIALLIIAIIAIAVFFPLAVIWSINLLFDFSIAYTIDTWAAVVVLGVFLNGIRAK